MVWGSHTPSLPGDRRGPSPSPLSSGEEAGPWGRSAVWKTFPQIAGLGEAHGGRGLPSRAGSLQEPRQAVGHGPADPRQRRRRSHQTLRRELWAPLRGPPLRWPLGAPAPWVPGRAVARVPHPTSHQEMRPHLVECGGALGVSQVQVPVPAPPLGALGQVT